MWVNYGCIKGTLIWFICKNGKDPKIKSYCKCFGRIQHWEPQEERKGKVMALRRHHRNITVRFWDLLVGLVDESITVTVIPETFGHWLIRKEKGTSELHFWVGTFFSPEYSIAARLAPGKRLMKFISNAALLRVSWSPLGTTERHMWRKRGVWPVQRAEMLGWCAGQEEFSPTSGCQTEPATEGFLLKNPQLVKHIVLTRSHRETKKVRRQHYKIPFQGRNKFLALLTGLNLNQLKAGKRKSSKNHRNKYEMGIYEGFTL